MTDLKDTKVLKRLPDFLLKRLDDNSLTGNETLPFESLKPNTINLTAAIIEKVIEDLDEIKFNDWSDFELYVQEFKLSEVFENIDEGFYTVKDPELLKGFFAFKGTDVDIQYLLKVSGYSLVIYDAGYFEGAESMYELLVTRPGDHGAEIDLILAAMTQEEIDIGFAKLTPWSVDNVNPLINNPSNNLFLINAIGTIEDLLSSYGVSLSPDALTYVESLYLIFIDSFSANYDKGNCEIKSQLFVDLDSTSFKGFKSNTTTKQIKTLLRTRISPCVYVGATEALLETKDYFSVPTKVSDALELQMTETTAEDAPTFTEALFLEVNFTFPEETLYLETDDIHIMTNARNDDLYKVDNLNPLKIKGNNNHIFLEETLEVYTQVEIPVITVWQPVGDGLGFVDPSSYPTKRKEKSFDVRGLGASTLNTSIGLIKEGDIVKFNSAGEISSITELDSFTPISDGLGNVDKTSYPENRDGKYFRVSGMASSLVSDVGILNNNDTIYFDFDGELSLSVLI